MSVGDYVILTDEPESASLVVEALRRSGEDVVTIAPGSIGTDVRITVIANPGDQTYGAVETASGITTIRSSTRVWRWKCGVPGAGTNLDADDAVDSFLRDQYRSALTSLWSLPALWMNPWLADRHLDQNKTYGNQIASESGLRVIPTICADSDLSVAHFMQQFPAGQKFAVKAASAWAAGIGTSDDVLGAYTVCLSASELRDVLADARPSPILVQPYIDKQYELRVTVVNSTAFACRIDSQSSPTTMIDWRRYGRSYVAHDPYELPPEIERYLRQFMSKSALRYCAFDFIQSSQGDLFFVEANPAGQFGWIEHLTGMGISGAIADWLLGIGHRT